MAQITGCFVGMTESELAAQRAIVIAGLKSVGRLGTSTSVSSHSTQREASAEFRHQLLEIQYALDLLSGARPETTYADLSA